MAIFKKQKSAVVQTKKSNIPDIAAKKTRQTAAIEAPLGPAITESVLFETSLSDMRSGMPANMIDGRIARKSGILMSQINPLFQLLVCKTYPKRMRYGPYVKATVISPAPL